MRSLRQAVRCACLHAAPCVHALPRAGPAPRSPDAFFLPPFLPLLIRLFLPTAIVTTSAAQREEGEGGDAGCQGAQGRLSVGVWTASEGGRAACNGKLCLESLIACSHPSGSKLAWMDMPSLQASLHDNSCCLSSAVLSPIQPTCQFWWHNLHVLQSLHVPAPPCMHAQRCLAAWHMHCAASTRCYPGLRHTVRCQWD